jgi:hypothetical protein
MPVPSSDTTRRAFADIALPRLCAIVVVVFGLLPIANWIDGGHEASWYGVSASEWMNGTFISIGAAVVGFIIARRLGDGPSRLIQRFSAAAHERPWVTGFVLMGAAFVLYALIARLVLSGRPLFIDEIVQVMQARVFASGRLTLPTAPQPEFFSSLHVVDFGGRSFSHFPPGGPAMLVPGALLGAPWLVGPLFGALTAGLYWRIVRAVDVRPSVSLGAALLFAAAPFTAFMAGSHMNHVTTLFWLCVAMVGLLHVVSAERRSPWMALACGLGFGIAATIRPTDAMAFAVPAAVWLLWRSRGTPGAWLDVAAAGAGVAIPLVFLFAYNAYTTGQPLLFGYELLWGKSHGLGFHSAPWGAAHTPARGVELLNLYFLRLQTYLFETPLPSLVPAVIALALTPAVRGFDRYLLWSSALLVAGYFAYWHDGFFLGPRFFYPLVPALVLWTARLPAIVRERFPKVRDGARFVLLVYVASAGIALGLSIPVRARQYASGLTAMREDYLAPAAAMGVRDALVLVRESWGSQLIARLWALGVSRSETETLYRGIDTCVLELAVGELEREGRRGAGALVALAPLLRDSARVIASELSPDRTERVLPGTSYHPLCARRIEEDRAGYTFLTPILAAPRSANVYARDLHARDSLLLGALGARPVFVLRPRSSEPGAPLALFPVSLDSARADWRGQP